MIDVLVASSDVLWQRAILRLEISLLRRTWCSSPCNSVTSSHSLVLRILHASLNWFINPADVPTATSKNDSIFRLVACLLLLNVLKVFQHRISSAVWSVITTSTCVEIWRVATLLKTWMWVIWRISNWNCNRELITSSRNSAPTKKNRKHSWNVGKIEAKNTSIISLAYSRRRVCSTCSSEHDHQRCFLTAIQVEVIPTTRT